MLYQKYCIGNDKNFYFGNVTKIILKILHVYTNLKFNLDITNKKNQEFDFLFHSEIDHHGMQQAYKFT